MKIEVNKREWPHIEFWRLKNGANCATSQINGASLTCIDFWCKAGSFSELKGQEGIAHFLEHMIFKGSKNLSAGEFDQRIEALGGSSNAATGFDDVHFHALVPPENINSAIKLLLNLVLYPSIHMKDFEMEREVVLEEIAQYKDQPDDQVFQHLLKNCWGTHCYGRAILGLEKSLKLTSPTTMIDFHKKHYFADNCSLAIAGDLPGDIKDYLNSSELSELNQKLDVPQSKLKKLKFQTGRETIEIPRIECSRILMAWSIPNANEQLTIMGIDIAASILGEGRRSRLVSRLKEELQIVEHIDIELTTLEQGGILLLEAYCSQNNIKSVEREVDKILNDLINNEIKVEELNRALKLISNGLFFSLESTTQISNLAGNKSLWGRKEAIHHQVEYINYWNENNLKSDIFPYFTPSKRNTLIAIPEA